jgi:NTP pyrophosphatase (non-canonical NTP hydrolase)
VTNENEKMLTWVESIKLWHYDRNLITGSDDKTQFAKLIQEAGELSDNICKGKDIKDDIGDMIVVLINIAERNGLSLTECLEVAYNDIKDRKGRMIDGVFVKEADENLRKPSKPTYKNTASGQTRY